MSKKLTKRAQQALDTKNKIYKIGIQLFKEYGYHDVSVEMIAQQASVGIGTFYHYYSSKMKLFMEMFINVEDYLSEFEDIDLSTWNPREIILKYFTQYCSMHENVGLDFVQNISSATNQRFIKDKREFELTVENMIIYYQSQGSMRTDYEAKAMREVLFIAARGLMLDWSTYEGNYNLKDKVHFMINCLLDDFINEV